MSVIIWSSVDRLGGHVWPVPTLYKPQAHQLSNLDIWYSPQCCNACVSPIWGVTSILKLTPGMLFQNVIRCSCIHGRSSAGDTEAWSHLPLLHLDNSCDPPLCSWHRDSFLLAMFCCHCRSYIWTDQRRFFSQVPVCQFWEVCQAAYSMDAFSPRDKTEMTRQSPFCQHCHGSTGTAVYPKVNGMTPGTESARLRETCACFT